MSSSQSQPVVDGDPIPAITEAELAAAERTLDPQYWEVEVRIEGVSVLTIGHDHVAGVAEPELDLYADRIRACAEHLRAFIGTGEPTPCFACGDTRQERWMGACGEEIGPCSVCAAPGDREAVVPRDAQVVQPIRDEP